MTEIKDYEDWIKLFQAEQQGNTPQDLAYQPVPEISILPYSDHYKNSRPSFPHQNEKIMHSFVVDEWPVRRISNFATVVEPYHISAVYAGEDMVTERKELKSSKAIDPASFVKCLPGDSDGPLVLDLGSETILQQIKNTINTQWHDKRYIWLTPSHDFLWNIALVRGLKKYMINGSDQSFSTQHLMVYIPLQDSQDKENESQLIPLSNQLLSMMVSGINHIVWDIRNISAWQAANLTYLLNIPEILAREGKVLIKTDPIQGSDFFEELSDKVSDYLLEAI